MATYAIYTECGIIYIKNAYGKYIELFGEKDKSFYYIVVFIYMYKTKESTWNAIMSILLDN